MLALRLVALARRGRPADRVALRLFAEGLPVPGNTVRAAAVALLAALEHRLRTEIGVPDEPARDPWDDGGLLTAVDAYVDREPALQAAVRGRLRGVDVAEDGADARSVTVALVGGILGQPPADDEEQLLELALHAHGAHGLLEPAGPGVPRVLDDGVADVAHAIGRVSLPGLRAALARLPDHRVAHAWGLLTRLGGRRYARSRPIAPTTLAAPQPSVPSTSASRRRRPSSLVCTRSYRRNSGTTCPHAWVR